MEFKKGYIQKTNAFWNFKKSSDVMLRIDIVFKVQRGLVVSRVHPLEWLAMRPLLTCHFLYFDQFVLECNTLLGRPTRTHPLCGHPPIWCKEVSNYLTSISSGDFTEVTFRTWERIKWCAQLRPHVVCRYTLKILFLHVFFSFIFPRFWWKKIFFSGFWWSLPREVQLPEKEKSTILLPWLAKYNYNFPPKRESIACSWMRCIGSASLIRENDIYAFPKN